MMFRDCLGYKAQVFSSVTQLLILQNVNTGEVCEFVKYGGDE